MKIILALFLVLAGCATVGQKMDPGAIAAVKNGQTTRAQIVAAFGQPNQVIRDTSGSTTYTYFFMRATPGQIQNQMFMVNFDASEVVSTTFSSESDTR